jgi:CDP-2,3-bis-(O-geranylgeranyl)-sn-glycerol synthase
VHPILILQLLGLLAIANGAPVVVKKCAGRTWSMPIDGNLQCPDGRRLLGPSKTIRGLVIAVLATAAVAGLFGLEWQTGLVVGSAAMAGDICSSFVKRRLGLPASSRALGLDQIPESLFPLLACREQLAISFLDMAAIVEAFVIGELWLSRVLYAWHIRDRPY